MTTTTEAVDRRGQVSAELEHQPSDIERAIGGVELRLTALMIARGTMRDRDDAPGTVVTYVWPALEAGHRWRARRVLDGASWRSHTRIRYEHVDDQGLSAVDGEYGVNNGNSLVRLRPDKSSELSEGQQTVVLGEVRAALDTHIIAIGLSTDMGELVGADDEIVFATPGEWAQRIAPNERLALERQAMLNRHAGLPETEVVRRELNPGQLRRLQLVSGVVGAVEGVELHDDGVVPVVEAHLGTDAEGREFSVSYVGTSNREGVMTKNPDVIEVRHNGRDQVYVIEADGVVSFGAHVDDGDMVEESLQMGENLRALDAHLREVAANLSRDDLDLRLRIPLVLEGLGVGEQGKQPPYTFRVSVEGTNYFMAVFDRSERDSRYPVYIYDDDREDQEDQSATRILYVPTSMEEPITLSLADRRGPDELQAVIDRVATGLDRHLGVNTELQSDHEAALLLVTTHMDREATVRYEPYGTDGTERRAITIAGDYGQNFLVEQFRDATTPDGQPHARVTVLHTDIETGRQTTRGVYRLSADGFEAAGNRGPRNLLAGWRKNRRFNDLVASVANSPVGR